MICICEFQEDFLRDSLSVPLSIGARQLDRVLYTVACSIYLQTEFNQPHNFTRDIFIDISSLSFSTCFRKSDVSQS